MLRRVRPIALIVFATLASFHANAEPRLLLKSVNIDLPIGDRTFPDGVGSDTVNANCLACHSAGMVLNQPNLPKAQWRAEVEKMRTAYKAPIASKDIDTIVDYLASIKGEK
jgi:mono/diheme cytochrome c family protein